MFATNDYLHIGFDVLVIIEQQMIKLILLLLLLSLGKSQQQATLTQPSLIQTNTYILRRQSTGTINLSTNIAYMQNYTSAPLVFVSIVSMQSFIAPSIVSFSKSIQTITNKYFTISYTFSCISGITSCSFSRIDIDYLAYDFNSYPYVQILQSSFTLEPAITLQNQFHQIQYLQNLNENYSYQLNCMLTGFQTMTIIGQPKLNINLLYNNNQSYFININFDNLTVLTVDYLRILIDLTTMNAMSIGISSLNCDMGTIYHYSDPNVVVNNPTPDFLPFAMFFGVSGFAGYRISLTSLTYIFNNTYPRIQTQIGYVLFITQSCPTSQLYVSSQNLCYGLSSAFYYQATPATMQPCPYSCYQCVGPLTTQCKSCVTGWNRVLTSGRCVCISGFYDPGGPQCKNCTIAISGCKTCSSATNCLTCLAGCTAIGFSPIYCDCPSLVQQNYSYNCLKSYYFDYSINTCTCLPQTYHNSAANMCFACAIGCYTCAKNSSYCLSCIDSYTLVKNSCMFFPISYTLLGQSSNYNSPKIRCLRWDSSNSVCLQKCKYYYYQFNCYNKCPMGTFNISFPWLTCQPCQLSCQYCFNYTICYQCNANYYYFNTSILSCSPCSSNCVKCVNGTYCTQCQTLYLLLNNSCQLPIIPSPICSTNCLFCLISNQCLQCKIPYYLNGSSQTCIQCAAILGLQIRSDGCYQICGDGKMINEECDDGNTVSGDGCSSQCFIESGYVCNKINGRSYCWARSIALDWQIISKIGVNQLIISLSSSNSALSNSIQSLQCGFNFTLTQRTTLKNRQQLHISYQQSILLMQLSSGSSNTIEYLSGNLSKNICEITVNRQQTFTILLNKKPTPLFIYYNSSLQSISNGNTLKTINKIAIYFSMATSVLVISPMTSYSCLRLYILLLASYYDCMHLPINAFAPYQTLSSLLFLPSSSTTRQLQFFTQEYYVSILWHLVVVYVSFSAWIQILLPFILRVCKSMQWVFLSRIFCLINQNKAIAYQNMYISYEIIIFILVIQTLHNISAASIALIILINIHMVFIVCSKIHFWFTYQQLSRLYPQFTHTLVIQQFQNMSIAALILTSTSKISFMPILMIVFGIYPLLSLDRNTQSPIKGGNYFITNQIAIWQLRIGYIFQIIIQILKLVNMWSANLPLSQSTFSSIVTNIGLSIGILTSFFMLLSLLATFIGHLIRFCQIKNQGRATIPSMQDVEADISSNAQ